MENDRPTKVEVGRHLTSPCNDLRALLTLPLCAVRVDGVGLGVSPEWRATCEVARHFESEALPNPPAAVDEVEAAPKALHQAPATRLYLQTTWMFAARAGNINLPSVENLPVGERRGWHGEGVVSDATGRECDSGDRAQ